MVAQDCNLISIMVAVIYIPTNNVELFPFPTFSPEFIVVYIIDDTQTRRITAI
jgi:hypothetical protein